MTYFEVEVEVGRGWNFWEVGFWFVGFWRGRFFGLTTVSKISKRKLEENNS